MKISKKLIIYSFSAISICIIISTLVVFLPLKPNESLDNEWVINYEGMGILQGTAAAYSIDESVQTSFGEYIPEQLDYQPSIIPIKINSDLSNVDLQGTELSNDLKKIISQYGFVIVDEGFTDIFEIYNTYNEDPFFVTSDLCLHTYHSLFDYSLRIIEADYFYNDFITILSALRDSQFNINSSVTEPIVYDALRKNIAYLSVMLYLLNDSYVIPIEVSELANSELDKINSSTLAESSIFGYIEDYSQYKPRGHYTKSEILKKYFKAMMYAGRMGFHLQNPMGGIEMGIEMGIEQTRMAMLLVSSFNSTIGDETCWDFWDKMYEPTTFYVGKSDDLTPKEYFQIWKNHSFVQGDELSDETLILAMIEDAKNYRDPRINSMFILDKFEFEDVTKSFRLFGQRFIPDSYIFQQLVHNKVTLRNFPKALDVFSVFGSSRAAYHLQEENTTYTDYNSKIHELRTEFGNLTDYDWTQNLYWMWLYNLFPLLNHASEGYPGFMLNDAWEDKSLMTTLGSWVELRHDTLLYAKQAYSFYYSGPHIKDGYVEPIPEVYSRLSSLVKLMYDGLTARGLLNETFNDKLLECKSIFDRLTEISIKELENIPLNESDVRFIGHVGENFGEILDSEIGDVSTGEANRLALIADVYTDVNTEQILEVAVGDPFIIYVVVQDHDGNLRLTKGGTFSYYEFKHPMNDRLTDEQWQEMVDSNPPDLPEWIINSPTMKTEELLSVILVAKKYH
ncbi:MAG: DUF3160 domain-containing protein [Asgard group archaeon]|nr:DUF3160 domain-containing protein [Asgard group archaeon]